MSWVTPSRAGREPLRGAAGGLGAGDAQLRNASVPAQGVQGVHHGQALLPGHGLRQGKASRDRSRAVIGRGIYSPIFHRISFLNRR